MLLSTHVVSACLSGRQEDRAVLGLHEDNMGTRATAAAERGRSLNVLAQTSPRAETPSSPPLSTATGLCPAHAWCTIKTVVSKRPPGSKAAVAQVFSRQNHNVSWRHMWSNCQTCTQSTGCFCPNQPLSLARHLPASCMTLNYKREESCGLEIYWNQWVSLLCLSRTLWFTFISQCCSLYSCFILFFKTIGCL